MKKSIFVFIFLGFFPSALEAERRLMYPWPKEHRTGLSVSSIPPPGGFKRISYSEDTFGSWLRGLPLKPKGSQVRYHTREKKKNQKIHQAILDIDVGKADLQQCADAVIRLRAEYLLAQERESEIHFNFTSGDKASWDKWQQGVRPTVLFGRKVFWRKKASFDDSYKNFRAYLKSVFRYAGSYSLAKEMKSVNTTLKVEAGDVFIQGGFPGHAVLVMDVAESASGERVFLLAQSYMPAQDIHILKNTNSPLSPWYPAKQKGPLTTPEWRFQYSDLKRF